MVYEIIVALCPGFTDSNGFEERLKRESLTMQVKVHVFLLVHLGEPSERFYLVGRYRKPSLPPVGLFQGVLALDRICRMMLLTNVSSSYNWTRTYWPHIPLYSHGTQQRQRNDVP